jgi:NAD(P)-dependent dehydrogenase (short-subunit alcohol dehydrogenase family)
LKTDLELQGSAVGVTVLCPGWVNTRIMDADRNRPGGPVDSDLISVGREAMRQVIAQGKDPAEVAHLVAAAVREGTTHVFTGDEWIDLARGRFQQVLAELPGDGA